MKNYSLLILGILLTPFCFSQEQSSNPDLPKATFVVQIGNEEYIVTEGEELKLDTTTISIKLASYRNFSSGDLSFKYPSNFSLEYDEDFGYKSWTLDGNNFVIMYFEIDVQTELDDFVDEMVSQFGRTNCRVERTQMKMGSKVLKGKRINISLVGQKLTLDFMEIEMPGHKSRFIAFQDSKNDDGSSSTESLKALKMINKTIKYE